MQGGGIQIGCVEIECSDITPRISGEFLVC